MASRPILFSAPMVRAILAGTKSQTRRIARLTDSARVKAIGSAKNWHCDDPEAVAACPYGVPGDELWVRETWGLHQPYDLTDWHHGHVSDRASVDEWEVDYRADWAQDHAPNHWRPSIHMPRWASRLTLKVTGVRVERLQAISAKDILAEGVVARRHDSEFGPQPVSAFDGKAYMDLVSLWATGWDTINGKRAPWASNPWVWVVTFRRLP